MFIKKEVGDIMVKRNIRYVGFKTYKSAMNHAKKHGHGNARFGYSKKQKHFYEF
jgi:hypothetical protein